MLSVVVPVLLILLWEWSAKNGLLNDTVFVAPSEIGVTWKDWIDDGKYLTYLLISVRRFLKGFALGTVLGLILGSLMGTLPKFRAAMNGIVGALRSIPNVGWIPIAIFTLGIGENSKVFLISIGCFWAVFVNTFDGIRGVNNRYLEVAQLLEKSKTVTLFRVILPSAFPSVLTGMREGFSNSWRGIVAAEMIASSSGIGFMIAYSREITRPDIMYIGLATIGLGGMVLDIILISIQNRVLRLFVNESDIN